MAGSLQHNDNTRLAKIFVRSLESRRARAQHSSGLWFLPRNAALSFELLVAPSSFRFTILVPSRVDASGHAHACRMPFSSCGSRCLSQFVFLRVLLGPARPAGLGLCCTMDDAVAGLRCATVPVSRGGPSCERARADTDQCRRVRASHLLLAPQAAEVCFSRGW